MLKGRLRKPVERKDKNFKKYARKWRKEKRMKEGRWK
jgi:hypothetical protein